MSFIFKFLISSVLLVSSLPDEGGWFPVEKEVKVPEQPEDRDPSIWALFAKKMGQETFTIRFPDEPAYRYLDSGAIVISSEKEGETFELTVSEAQAAFSGPDVLYQLDGKWVREHFVQTEHHLFHFKTLRNTLDEEFSNLFFFSILIEKNH